MRKVTTILQLMHASLSPWPSRATTMSRYWHGLAANTEPRAWHEGLVIRDSQPLVLDASTWTAFRLFDGGVGADGVRSPCGQWVYNEAVLAAATPLRLSTSKVRTHVVFNGDVTVPRVMERQELWMSYTPQEVLTQRPGLRMARGHVIVAGLGMGWLLTRVAAKSSVTRITLVERSRDLVDWLLPTVIDRHIGADVAAGKALDVVVADARDVIPGMTADVALWDIWEGLGAVDQRDCRDMARRCPGVGRTWFWGATTRIPCDIWR